MNTLEEWFQTARSVVEGPTEFFESESRRDGFQYPVRFAAISIVVSVLLTTVRNLVFTPAGNLGGPLTVALGSLLGGLAFGFVALFLWSGIVHLIAYLVGARRGYRTTFAVMAYATALSPVSALLSFIPFLGAMLGFLVALYSAYIQIRGIEKFQEIETVKAAVAVLLPVLVMMIVAVVVFVLALMFLITTGTVTQPPVPTP